MLLMGLVHRSFQLQIKIPHDQDITWKVPQTPPELPLACGHRLYISGSPTIIQGLLPETFADGFQLPEPMIPIDQLLEANPGIP